MITDEQIKNLKPGDPLLIHGTFTHLHADGDIEYKAAFIGSYNKLTPTVRTAHSSCVSLPENGKKNTEEAPKHDPCRKLRKGDIVEPRELYGRKHKALNYNYKYEVLEDEDKDGVVKVEYFDGGFTCTSYIPFYWFELVTPVEELEPYEVTESSDYYGVDKDDLEVEAAIFWKKSHPNAKAAAEAECARLNEEYRKEQNNG